MDRKNKHSSGRTAPKGAQRPVLMLWHVAFLGIILGAVLPHTAFAQPFSQGMGPGMLEEVAEVVEMDVGTSQAIRAPWLVKGVAVADPEVADVQVLEPDQVLVVAKAPGTTDLIVWSEDAEVWRARIRVEVDLQQLKDSLTNLFPDASLDVSKSQDVYCVTGSLARAEHTGQLHRFLDMAEIKYVDMTKLAGLQQVQIQIRVAEANRIAIRKLGINALHVGEDFFGAATVGTDTGGALNPISIGPLEGMAAQTNMPFFFTDDVAASPFVTLLAGFPDADLEFFIQALVENEYLRILAEPNLVALSGEEASFLAGGEFPIPIVQGTTAGGGTAITIEYKEFGVRLQFRPTVLGNGTIRLHVAPEVSDLSDIGAVEIEGFSVPSVLTRRSETTLELNSGQTFAMAGLLNKTTNARNSRVPLMGALPVLGPLFRSVRYQEGESELVILVTATLVEPLSLAERPDLPGDSHNPPTSWELFMKGDIEATAQSQSSGSPGGPNLAAGKKLLGPGPWASYHPGDSE